MLRLLSVLLLVLPLAACGSDDDAALPDSSLSIPQGDAITDSTDALIVTSSFGTDTLSLQMFGQQYGGYVQQMMQQDPTLASDSLRLREIRRRIAESFILQHVIEGMAQAEPSTGEDSSEVESRIQGFREQLGEEQFQQQLAAEGIALDSLRTMLILQQRAERVQRTMIDATPQPSPAEVETFRSEQAEEVRANQIAFFLFPGYSQAQRDSVERTAQIVLDSIRAGAPFGDMARRYSTDPTGQTGGDTDFFNRSAGFPKPFTDATFALSDSGDVADELVRTQVGLHVVQLTGRRMGIPMDSTRARTALRAERQDKALRNALVKSFQDASGTARVNEALLEIKLDDEYEID